MFKFQAFRRLLARRVGMNQTEVINVIFSRGLSKFPAEPDYLDSEGPQIPLHEPLNVQIKSYDFTVLEKFSGYIHKTAENMGIEVDDCWAAPCKKHKIQTFKPFSAQVESQYNLNIYERNVQVVDLEATKAPLFFHIIQAALPEGVKMTVKPHDDTDEEHRYVPDLELTQLKNELNALGGPTASKGKR
uniref:EOG090X0MUO n=1 Tax=Daphnia dolichocephala TaxID=2282166 RepID=A0A4Y7M4S2_9CRUS|nr:EOG090X0MUO [Daphnia dolichocephala]